MSTDTPQFNRQADTGLKPYIQNPFENKHNLGLPPRPMKQTVEPSVLIEENFQIEKYNNANGYKSYNTEGEERSNSSPNAKGSVIMSLLKQMVDASNLDGTVLKKHHNMPNDEIPQQVRLQGRPLSNSTVKEEEDEDDDEEEEDLEPPKTEKLPFRIQKIVSNMKMNPRIDPEASKQSRSRSPATRSLSRSKIPKPSKQETYEKTYKTSLKSIKNRYATTLEQKKLKELNKALQNRSDDDKEMFLNKENAVPNMSPDHAGKIKRQRGESTEPSTRLLASPSSTLPCETGERDNTRVKRNLFNVFGIKLDEISRIENLKKDMRQTDYFNNILFDSAPRATTNVKQFIRDEFYEKKLQGKLPFTQQTSRLEIIRAIDFLQLYQHTSYLREIHETRGNIKKISAGILKLQKDNAAFTQAAKSAELDNNKKQNIRKPMKEINIHENETKIVLLRELTNRMVQKVIVLALKYLRAARILRENLIDKTQKHFDQNSCHYALAAFCQFKQLGEEKRKVQAIAIERVLVIRKTFIWSRWVKFAKHYNLKRGQAAQSGDFNSRRLLRRAFQALTSQKGLKAMRNLSSTQAQMYSNRIRLARFFYGIQFMVDVAKKSSFHKKRGIDFTNNEYRLNLKQKLAKAYKEAKNKMLVVLKSKGRVYSSPGKKLKSIIHQPDTQLLKMRALKTSTPSRLNSIMAPLNKCRGTQENTEIVELNSQSLFERALQYKRTKYGHNLLNKELTTEIKEHIMAMIIVYKTLLKPSHSQENHRGQTFKSVPRDINEAEKVLAQRHRQHQLIHVFTTWKLAFLERWLEIELDLLHTMNFSCRIITNLKGLIARRANDERYNIEIADYCYLSRIFKSWKRASEIENSTKNIIARNFYTKLFFWRWINYLEYKKKRHLVLKESLQACQKSKLHRLLRAWNDKSKKNYEVRELKKLLLQRRVLRIWRRKWKSREVLKKFFTLMFDVANSYTQQTPPAKSKFQLLFKIMKAWRNEVIENENTCEQKIARLTAINHFNNHQKYKSFRGWKRIPCYLKAFPILIKNLKLNLSTNVFKKWHVLASETHKTLSCLGKEKHFRLLQKYFDHIKAFNLQEKLIRALNVKRFFLAWRTSNEVNRFLPSKYYFRSLLRKSLKAMKLYIRERINALKRTSAASRLEKQKKLRLGRMALYSLIDNAIKHKTKNLLQQRGISFRARFLKQRAMLGLKDYLYLRRVKKEKTLIALNFRKARRCLVLRIGVHFKAYPNFKNAASLLLSAWRAIALRAKNERIVANRFVRLRSRNCLRRYFVEWHEEYLKVDYKPLKTPSFKVDLEKYLPTKIENMKKSVRFGDEPLNRSQSDASTHDISKISFEDSRSNMNENLVRRFQVSQIRETKNLQK